MKRLELLEKYEHISEEEQERLDRMNIQPKNRKLKWRKIWLYPDNIFSLKEVNEVESMVEFHDSTFTFVKGNYEQIKKLINDAEEENEEDLIMD